MNVQFRAGAEPASSVAVKSAIADCDIHPARATATELYPYFAKRWHDHLETYGKHPYQGMMEGPPYPKAQPNASRRDAYPPEGGPQGSSLSFMQKQLLDPNNVALGVLNPLQTGQGIRNQDLSAALASAINDWQIDKWTSQDSRLKGSVVVGNEDGPTAAAEIRKRAGDKNFVQVLLLSRNVEPLGQRRYWPIYEAAQEIGLPVGVHAFGFGGNPITASGWPSFYIEEMVGHYKRSKWMAEQEVLKAGKESLPVIVAMPTTPVGPWDWKPTPTGKIIVDFLNGKMPGYVETGLNLVDATECARGHVQALEKGRSGERYILGGENLTLKQILDRLAAITGFAQRAGAAMFQARSDMPSNSICGKALTSPPEV